MFSFNYLLCELFFGAAGADVEAVFCGSFLALPGDFRGEF